MHGHPTNVPGLVYAGAVTIAQATEGLTLISTVYPVRFPMGRFWYKGAAMAVILSDNIQFRTTNV